MINNDIRQTIAFGPIAREFIAAVNLEEGKAYTREPEKTLLNLFCKVMGRLSFKETVDTFPLITMELERNCGNNPLKFDWMALAVAVDNARGIYPFKIQEVN